MQKKHYLCPELIMYRMKNRRFIYCLLLGCFPLFLCAATITGTLSVVYMTTDDGLAITDKETYKAGKVYIDPLNTGKAALGSSDAPLAAELKGRGNYTWRDFDKKPYKIKFAKGQSVFGLPKNKHWVLLAGADDDLGFLRNPAGFAVSRAVGLRWTPAIEPVELVLNGQYQGLYFLVEHVRIDPSRINIQEQEDGETAPEIITGGWLVEIDNYAEENNIEFDEGNGQHVMVSLGEPEVLSSQQRQYIEQQMYNLNNILYGSSSAALEQVLDIEEAAKFYLVQEIMEDCESYHGSCKLYKDRDTLGMADKWKFGPVWDFGNAYMRHQEKWIYVDPTWPQYWIGQLATWPVFQEKVKEQWWIYYHEHKDQVRAEIRAYANTIETAAKNDAQVWRGTQNYRDNSNFSDVRDRFFRRYDWRINWLYQQWGEGIKPATWDIDNVQDGAAASRKILRDGQLLILRGDKTYTVQGQVVDK